MAGKIITLNKDEVIKVVELARGFLMTFETNYICYGLFKGIEKLKKIEIDSNHSSSYNILKEYPAESLKIVVNSSANLTENVRFEAGVIYVCSGVYNSYFEKVNNMFVQSTLIDYADMH